MATPQIVRVYPAHNIASVELLPTIELEWSLDLDVTTVVPERFYLTRVSDHTSVGVTGLLVQGRLVTCTPEAALTPGEAYTLTVAAGIRAVVGTATVRAFTSAFTTAVTEQIDAPQLITPNDGGHTEAFACTWNNVDDDATYTLQICNSRTFSGDGLREYTGISGTSFEPEDVFAADSYYLRIYAQKTVDDVIISSAWSTVISVSYNTYKDTSGDAPNLGSLWSIPAGSFLLTRMLPASGSANTTPTRVVLTFTNAPHEDTLDDTKDEYAPPTIVAIPLSGGAASTVTGSWEISSKSLIYTGTFAENTTYEIALDPNLQDTSGAFLADEPALWFTTGFTVLYAMPQQLRAMLGTVVQDYADDLLYTHIFQASLGTNVRLLGRDATYATALEPLTGDDLTMGVVNETLLRAKISLLTQKLAEIAANGNESKVLGDFEYEYSYANTETLQGMLDSAISELNAATAGMVSLKAGATLPSVSEGTQPVSRSSF